MLLVCAGPDSFQALRKARELELMYREKYDPTGISIERVTLGNKSLEGLAERFGTMGLFAQRRCLRVTGLVSSWKKADWDRATKLFARDPEQTIVISLEEEISPEAERMISGWERSRVYRHTPLVGLAFQTLTKQLAQEQGVEYGPELQAYARTIEGDAWSFWNALPRWKATQGLPEALSVEETPFSQSDEYLTGGSSGKRVFSDNDGLLPLVLQQARQGLRVVAGRSDVRMPAFAQKKWQQLNAEQRKTLSERAQKAIEATIIQRTGGISDGEAALLL